MIETLVIGSLLTLGAIVAAVLLTVWVAFRVVLWVVLLPLRLLLWTLLLPLMLLKMAVVGVVGTFLAIVALPVLAVGGTVALLGLIGSLLVGAAPLLFVALVVWLIVRASTPARSAVTGTAVR